MALETFNNLMDQLLDAHQREVQDSYVLGMTDERKIREGAEAIAAQPIVLPRALGAIVEAEDTFDHTTYRIILADTVDPNGESWFQISTQDWYTPDELIKRFANILVVHRGLEQDW